MKIKYKKPLFANNPDNPYSCKELTLVVGQEAEVSQELGSRLMVDFPGKFVEILGNTELEVLSDADMAELDIEVTDVEVEKKTSPRKNLNFLKKKKK